MKYVKRKTYLDIYKEAHRKVLLRRDEGLLEIKNEILGSLNEDLILCGSSCYRCNSTKELNPCRIFFGGHTNLKRLAPYKVKIKNLKESFICLDCLKKWKKGYEDKFLEIIKNGSTFFQDNSNKYCSFFLDKRNKYILVFYFEEVNGEAKQVLIDFDNLKNRYNYCVCKGNNIGFDKPLNKSYFNRKCDIGKQNLDKYGNKRDD